MNETAMSPEGEHDEIMLLLPWYANGTLAPGEQGRVRAHLTTCGSCAAALRDDQAIREAFTAPSPAPMLDEVGLARLKQRVRAEKQSATVPAIAPPAVRRGLAARPALVAAALILIAAPIAFTVHLGGSGRQFHTLSSEPPSAISHHGNDVRIVFASSLTAAERQALLAPFAGIVLDGPNSVGAYTVRLQAVEPDPRALQKALDLLRQQQSVRLAESIAPGATP